MYKGFQDDERLGGCQRIGNVAPVISYRITPAIIQVITEGTFPNAASNPGPAGLGGGLAQRPVHKTKAYCLPDYILNGDGIRTGDKISLGDNLERNLAATPSPYFHRHFDAIFQSGDLLLLIRIGAGKGYRMICNN